VFGTEERKHEAKYCIKLQLLLHKLQFVFIWKNQPANSVYGNCRCWLLGKTYRKVINILCERIVL
jgi:hypothetical protein